LDLRSVLEASVLIVRTQEQPLELRKEQQLVLRNRSR
jgi:hypothetical protein